MPRPSRPPDDAELARGCAFCGAGRGEYCTNPDGRTYQGGAHTARLSGIPVMPRGAQPSRDLDEEYEVIICRHCKHPGGQHLISTGCRLCATCPGYEDGFRDYRWSDRRTGELLAAMANAIEDTEGSDA